MPGRGRRPARSGSSAAAAARAPRSRAPAGCAFAANYHVSPATVLEAVDGYRAAFQPSDGLDRPYVSVSADVVVAEDEATARELATGYGLWVRSIRTAEGAIPFPTPEEARAPRVERRRPRRWSPTASTPSSSAPRARSPTSWNVSATPPGPTSCSSRPSPTTTPTGSVPTSCSPRNGPRRLRERHRRSGRHGNLGPSAPDATFHCPHDRSRCRTDDLDRIAAEAAWRSPSASNRQHWDFVIVTDPDRLPRCPGVGAAPGTSRGRRRHRARRPQTTQRRPHPPGRLLRPRPGDLQ